MRRMTRDLLRDETGITMVLAIMTVVIVGVMGAGLLTFAMRDLDSVVETNRGHTAQEMADAGLEAAKRQLARVDARPSQYDGDTDNGESDFSDDGSPMILSFEGNEITVGIRYLQPSTTNSDTEDPDLAPEILPLGATDGEADDDADPDYPKNRHYFRVTVEGNAGNTGDTLRRFQAIHKTENYELPVGYFATRDIHIGGDASVKGVSLFAERYITNLDPDKKTGSKITCGTLCLEDQAYGNWATFPNGDPNPYNRVARGSTKAGAAALGGSAADACPSSSQSGIQYASTNEDTAQKARQDDPQHYGVRDFDRDSDYVCSGSAASLSGQPGFSAKTWGDPSDQLSLSPPQITFPFPARDDDIDAAMLDDLRAKAVDQNRYLRVENGTSNTTIDIGDTPWGNTPAEAVYPETSDLGTVMFIEFTGTSKGDVMYKPGRNGDLYKGTIVVVNGDLNTISRSANFEGVFIVRDGLSPGSETIDDRVPLFDNGGSLDIDGFVNVEGDIRLQGSVGGILPGELLNGVPGLVSVDLWSLRECYDEGCG